MPRLSVLEAFIAGCVCGWLGFAVYSLFGSEPQTSEPAVVQSSISVRSVRAPIGDGFFEDNNAPGQPATELVPPPSVATIEVDERFTNSAEDSLPQEIQALLNQGLYVDAVGRYDEQCLQTQWRELCRNQITNTLATLWSDNLYAYRELLDLYARVEPYNGLTRYHSALLMVRDGKVKDALAELVDLSFQPHVDVAHETILGTIEQVVDRTVAVLDEADNVSALFSFINYMIEIDNSNQRYPYLLGRAQYKKGMELQALETLSGIVYAPEWGEAARQIITEIKERYRREQEIAARTRQRAELRERQESQRFLVPLTRVGQHFLVNALVDNRELRLMVDTGASMTTLDRARANVKSPPLRRITVNTAGGKRRAEVHRVNHFSVENIAVPDMEIALMDLTELREAVGLLGMNYLGHFNFYIDQDEPALYLQSRIQFQGAP